jgi:hypothetical protein
MSLKWVMPVAPVIALIAYSVAGEEKRKASMLADAVQEFNRRAQKDATGKGQPALTEDEVVAAIRLWNRKQVPSTDEVYKVYQTIAGTKKLPESARLRFTTKCTASKYEFDVWWIDLDIKTGAKTGYTFRIRDRKLGCRPLAP